VNLYECIVILDAGLNDESIDEAVKKVQDQITDGGGEILKTDPWGRRKMGYEINKQKRGFYLLVIFRAPSDLISRMERMFKVYDPVIKFMVVRLEKKQAEGTLKALEAEKNAPAAEEAPAEAEKAPVEAKKPAEAEKAPVEAPAEKAAEAPKEE
jgi:small subunit ribosomal protein S6